MAISILWGITGSGDLIREIVTMMEDINRRPGVDVTVVVSKASHTVLELYGIWDEVESSFASVNMEKDPNNPFMAGALQTGKYDVFFICPATANTTAKIALGIADSLVSNSAAMAMKSGVHVYIFPVDQKRGELTTEVPGGGKLTITMRDVDVDNVERLRNMDGVTVLAHPNEFIKVIENLE